MKLEYDIEVFKQKQQYDKMKSEENFNGSGKQPQQPSPSKKDGKSSATKAGSKRTLEEMKASPESPSKSASKDAPAQIIQ